MPDLPSFDMAASDWHFTKTFRRKAYGWRSSSLAVARVREAVAEVRLANRLDPRFAAEGAVLFLRKVSPALEDVDSSSGALGAAVHHAIAELVPVIANAPCDAATREKWLDSLFDALQDDQIPYIETLSDHWGTLCASPDIAATWAERLVGIVERIFDDATPPGAHFAGTSACLSALHASGQHQRLLRLLDCRRGGFWHYRIWGVKALRSLGRHDEALAYADATDRRWAPAAHVAAVCEAILLDQGKVDEAYARFGLAATTATTHVARLRALLRKYPGRAPADILHDLVAEDPTRSGKWFAAAKDLKLYDEAIELATRSPADPHTLLRAARDFETRRPAFAIACARLALHWVDRGYGFDVMAADVQQAHTIIARCLSAGDDGQTARDAT